MSSDRPYDIVVFGATGFTGKQAARYLDQHGPAGLRLAIAGRSKAKLEEVAKSLGRPVGIVIADAVRPETIAAMVRSTRVICTTAGPFTRYGSEVVASCVKYQTDYCDITGETPWVRDMIDRYQAQAVNDGTRLVPFAGYDSCPSDLGTFLLARAAAARGEKLSRVDAFHSGRGGVNGGTLATVVAMGEDGRDRDLAKPFLLCPGFQPSETQLQASKDPRRVTYHPEARRYTAPFLMGQINTRVVRRSAWLLAGDESPYAADFVYQEYAGQRTKLGAEALLLGLGLAFTLVRRSWGRGLVARFGPAPGRGPSEAQMDNGYFRSRFYGVTSRGAKLKAEFSGAGDPGNRVTVCFLGEAALALAFERDRLPTRAGFLTPVTAFGELLIDRVKARGFRAELS